MVNSVLTVGDVRATGLPLGVKCDHCLHRALVDYRELETRARGDLAHRVAMLRFRCSKCGRQRVRFEAFRKRSEIPRFMRNEG